MCQVIMVPSGSPGWTRENSIVLNIGFLNDRVEENFDEYMVRLLVFCGSAMACVRIL